MTDEQEVGRLLAAGGWSSPTADLYAMYPRPAPIEFPEVSVQRGGIDYGMVSLRTDAERAADEAMQARWRRAVDQLLRARHAVIERAAVTALHHHWDLHVWEPQEPVNFYRLEDRELARLAYIGIGFEPGALAVPVIHYHRYNPDYWMAWDDDD